MFAKCLWFRAECPILHDMLSTQPVKNLREGLETKRFHFQPEQLASVIALLAGSWVGCGRILGVPRSEAQACSDLPPLPPGEF